MTIKNQLRKDVARLPVMVLLALGCFQLASFQFASVTQAAESSSSGGTESASNWALLKGDPNGMSQYLNAYAMKVNKSGQNLSNQAAIDDVLFKFSLSLHDLEKHVVGSAEYIAAGEKSQRLYAEYRDRVGELKKKFDKVFHTNEAPAQFLSVSPQSISTLNSKFSKDWLSAQKRVGVDDLFKVFELPQFSAADFNDPARRRVILGQLSYNSIHSQRKQMLTAFELLRTADRDGLRFALDDLGSGRTFFSTNESSPENNKRSFLKEKLEQARKGLPAGRIGNKVGVFSVAAAGVLIASYANAGEAKSSFIDEEPADRPTANDAGWARVKPAKGISK